MGGIAALPAWSSQPSIVPIGTVDSKGIRIDQQFFWIEPAAFVRSILPIGSEAVTGALAQSLNRTGKDAVVSTLRARGSQSRGAPVVIELWTDLGCPWCYVGKHRLQRAIDRRPDADRFQIKLRSFELNPDAPREPESIESAFTRSHGGNAEAVLSAERRIQGIAQREGLAFSLD